VFVSHKTIIQRSPKDLIHELEKDSSVIDQTEDGRVVRRRLEGQPGAVADVGAQAAAKDDADQLK